MGSGVAGQCSRNRCLPQLDGLGSPSWPPRPSRSSELEERPGHGPDPRFLFSIGGHAGTELQELAPDPQIAPPWVVLRHQEDELGREDLVRLGWRSVAGVAFPGSRRLDLIGHRVDAGIGSADNSVIAHYAVECVAHTSPSAFLIPDAQKEEAPLVRPKSR